MSHDQAPPSGAVPEAAGASPSLVAGASKGRPSPVGSCAIYAPGLLTPRTNPFGKDVANLGLWRALASHSDLNELCVVLHESSTPRQVMEALSPPETSPTRITTTTIFDIRTLARIGILLRGGAGLADLAWQRRATGGDSAYSLVGLVHTVAPPEMRQTFAQSAIAPVESWDALICTSPGVRKNLEEMFRGWNDYLIGRFGQEPRRPRMPMLPVVPLGVDYETIAADADRPAARAESRRRLSIAEDDVLVLWLGRLSFFEKAFPQPMFQALEAARARGNRRIHFAMAGWFPDASASRTMYEQAARLHAPSIPVHFLDGNDRRLVAGMWAAADIFLSLVDNVQETFGLAPVEAMAAGLPIVASDWDGYRSTIEHGKQGFLIPTLGGPAGLGGTMLMRHLLSLDAYQQYVGAIAQYTAVNVTKAAEAIATLAGDEELRRTMGLSGRARVRSHFDWPVVVRQYAGLFAELADMRARAQPFETPRHRASPVKGEPFSTFARFATGVLHDGVILRVGAAATMSPTRALEGSRLNQFAGRWRASIGEIEAAFGMLCEAGQLTVGEILGRFPKERRQPLQAGLLWMCKLGLADWDDDR